MCRGASQDMFFRVENLGPLREAEVDLSKGLILLTGPNNTGKTYLAWSIYALHRSPSAPKALRALLDEILASPTQSLSNERTRAILPDVLEEASGQLGKQLYRCFGAPRASFPDVRVTIRFQDERRRDNIAAIATQIIKDLVTLLFKQLGMRQEPLKPSLHSIPTLPEGIRAQVINSLHSIFPEIIINVILSLDPCILLPAERTAIDVFAKELLNGRNNAIQQIKESQLDGEADLSAIRPIGRYPWPIEDSLSIATNLSLHAKDDGKFADLATELESLLGGTVGLSNDGEFHFTVKEQSAKPIAIQLSSSVVKSLVSLIFYLRHSATPGNVLMIDEPELNLHPDNQRRVTRILAKAVNRGLRVIMSTHSDYVLREINNLILLGRDSDAINAVREKHGYSTDELLVPDKVGPYLFRNGGCEAIPVTADGFEVKTIEDEINRLNEISQDIYAALL